MPGLVQCLRVQGDRWWQKELRTNHQRGGQPEFLQECDWFVVLKDGRPRLYKPKNRCARDCREWG